MKLKKILLSILFLLVYTISYSQQIGNGYPPNTIPSFNTDLLSGFYQGNSATGQVQTGYAHLLNLRHNNLTNTHQLQITSSYSEDDKLYFRKFARGTLGINNPTWFEIATRGVNTFVGNQTINGVLNVTANNALNFSTHGGGFYMSDTSWIRTFGNKNFYHNTGIMRTDGIFHVGPNGDRLVVNTNGFVGIGTTTPTANLEIFKNLSKSVLKISNSDPASLNTELRLGGNNTFEKSAIISAPNPAGWYRQDLYFCLANGNNSSSVAISDAAMIIKSYKDGQFGFVGIGTTNPDQKLTVKGKIHSEEVIVDLAVPADYVFQKYYTGKSELKADYKLPTLTEIEDFTKQNHHLPNVPSAAAIKEKGLQLGEMSNILLQKIEELTLYAIEQDKKTSEQQKEIDRLKKENENYKSLAERLSAIERELKK